MNGFAAQVTVLSQSLPVRLQSPWLLPAALLVGAALAATVLWLYPPQTRALRRPWRYLLPVLRLLAFTVLAVSICRPVVLRATPSEDRGVLLVLLDRSASMGVVDSGRGPAELVATADALNLLPTGLRAGSTSTITGQFDQLQASVALASRAQGDLDYARVSGRGVETAEARVGRSVDDACRRAREVADRAAGLTDDPALRKKTEPLRTLPTTDTQGGWVIPMRRAVDQAATAVARFQDLADRKLYQDDPRVRRICQSLALRSRLQLAEEVLWQSGGLAATLGSQTPMITYSFGDGVQLVDAPPTPLAPPSDGVPGAVIDPSSGRSSGVTEPSGSSSDVPAVFAADAIGVRADGFSSDLPAAVGQVSRLAEGRPVRGILLLSDGQQVATTPALSVPSRVSSGTTPGVPLIALDCAGLRAPPDLAIQEVTFPRFMFAGQAFIVRVQLRGTGGVAVDPARVWIAPDGGTAIPPRSVDRVIDRKEVRTGWATFSVSIDEPGVHELVISTPTQPGEVSSQNNEVRRWVKIAPDHLRVLAVAGSAGRDFQFLQAGLTERAGFAFRSVVLPAGKGRVTLTAEEILAQDVVVLYDLAANALERPLWEAIDRLVTQRGGSVVFVAGPAMDLSQYAAQPAGALLPFLFTAGSKPAWRTASSERGLIRFIPASDFAKTEFFRIDDPGGPARRWQELPGMYRTLAVRTAKPGVHPILRETETNQAAATEMSAGAGRSFYIGFDETWRWRMRGNINDQDRFWRQLLRHAAEEPYTAIAGGLALDLDRVAVAPTDTVQVRVRMLPLERVETPSPARSLEDLRLDVTSAKTKAAVRSLPLSESTDSGGRIRLTLSDLPVGNYVVAVRKRDTRDRGTDGWPSIPLRIERRAEDELRNLSGDADRLRRMAESTGGRLLRVDQWSAIPGLLAAAADERPRFAEWRLWDSPWLFVFVVGCLGAEWALRKRAGLG